MILIKTKPFIKNRSRNVFYNFEKILRKNNFYRFGQKMAPINLFYRNKTYLSLFFYFKSI